MTLTKEELNAISQVTGLTQEKIKQDCKLNEYEDMTEFADFMKIKIKGFFKKEDLEGLRNYLLNCLGVIFFHIPADIRTEMITFALNKTLKVEEKEKIVTKIMKNESVEDKVKK